MNVVDIDDLCMGCMEPRQGAAQCPACGWVEGSPAENPVHLPPRTTLKDHYIVGRVLGHGGFGIAYLAWDSNLQMKLAVKEFFPGDFASRGANRATVAPYSGESKENFEYGLTKFLEEGRAVARFNDHPGIVPVLNFFRDNGTGYLVMQYVPGMSLKQYLQLKGGRIPYAEAIAIAMPVMDTLRAVHEFGLLHRDISPDNIYISTTKRVKLLDFGAARLAMGDRSKSLSVILKAGYAPFEQYQTKGKQGPWTDVYALAATIYRALTGVIPPEAPARIAGAEQMESPRALDVDMPPEAEDALLRALAIDPQHRYQSVGDFQEALLNASDVAPRGSHGASHSGPFSGRVSEVPQVMDPTVPVALPPPLPASARSPFPPGASPSRMAATVPAPSAAAGAQGMPAADLLRSIMDTIQGPVMMAATMVEQRLGLRPAPEDQTAVPRRGVLIAAVVIGALGVLWTLSLLSMLSTALVAASNLPVLVALLRALIGCAGAAAMIVAALAGLSGDRRGAEILWGIGWLLIGVGALGGLLQVLTYLPTASAGLIGFFLTSEIWATTQSLIPTAIILLLLWLRSSARSPAAA
jgi:serine/threonine protein kinase